MFTYIFDARITDYIETQAGYLRCLQLCSWCRLHHISLNGVLDNDHDDEDDDDDGVDMTTTTTTTMPNTI